MFEGAMDWLANLAGDPVSYLVFFFIFCILAAVILPIPVELGLLGVLAYDFSLFGLSVYPTYILVAGVLGLGKAVGGWLVFNIGVHLEDEIRRYAKWRWFKVLLERSSWFVSKAGYIGLYILLIIPGMTDTIPLYVFSLLNREGDIFEDGTFALTNLLAGFSRALIVGILVSIGISVI